MLANLISNALNQMPDGGALNVTAAASPGWVTIEVADTGPGIPPDQLDLVFQQVTKAGDSTGSWPRALHRPRPGGGRRGDDRCR